MDLSPLPGKPRGKLKLKPEALLAVIHGTTLAEWSLQEVKRFRRPHLAKGPGGRPICYRDRSIQLMAVMHTVWCKSYEAIVDQVSTRHSLVQALGLEGRTISQSQYWERRKRLGVLPFVFFFIALVAQLVRLSVITSPL